MAPPRSVWGIDIGKLALKALKLTIVEGELQVEAFDIIEHPKIITGEDADAQQIIHNALAQFVSRNDLTGSAIALAVPGQSSFTRFVPLPPVEKKKIPDIVRFEAEQQIPFAIDDVVWRWQTFQDPDSPDVEVGIFAMKRADIGQSLGHLAEVGLKVDVVQMSPLALYNFMRFDEQLAGDGATLLADVGTDNTNIVISDGSRIWTRTIQIGGNNFTEALVKVLKLSFVKAEKLKRTAATSKYARQIFQAMRPVFAELVQEIQRSVGYYTSLHRETRFKKLIGLGNGFRLPGLQKFLEQNLGIPVVRIDTFNRIRPSSSVNIPAFTENALSFAVAYGLAIQGLELSEINTNLLPGETAHKRLWAAKRTWFIGAAAALLISLAMFVYRANADRKMLADSSGARQATEIVSEYEGRNKDINQRKEEEARREKQRKTELAYRDYWPNAMDLLVGSLNGAFGEQRLILKYTQYRAIDKNLRDKIDAKDPATVRQVIEYARYLSIPEDLRSKLASRDGDTIRRLINHARYTSMDPELRPILTGKDAEAIAKELPAETLRDTMRHFAVRSTQELAAAISDARAFEAKYEAKDLKALMRLLPAGNADEIPAVLARTRAFEDTLGPENLCALGVLLADVQSDEALTQTLAQIRSFETTSHSARKIAVVENMEVSYFDDLKNAVANVEAVEQTVRKSAGTPEPRREAPGKEGASGRAFSVVMTLRTPVSTGKANEIFRDVKNLAEENAARIGGIGVKWFPPVEVGPVAAVGGKTPLRATPWASIRPGEPGAKGPQTKISDPLFPDEDMSEDIIFKIRWVITIEGK